jgi:protein involved in polysaccharide export with SLBB domain
MFSCASRWAQRWGLLVLFALTVAAAPPAAAADYVIQPEDVVAIQVAGHEELTKNYPVDEQGSIIMAMVGKLRLSGLTVKQAQEKVTESLGKYLKLFEVKLSVVGELGNRVLVFGEVAKPGSIKVRQEGKLLDVLAEAGQPTPNADRKRISVARKGSEKTQIIDLDAVLADPSLNIPIEAGDTITVPAKISRSVRVSGEVRTPGMKPLDEVKTAWAAVSAAGVTEKADITRVALRRKGSDIPLMVDLTNARRGIIKDDLPLQEGDELTVLSKFAGTATIRGEVKTPGEKELSGQTQLWDFVLTAGGGFSDKADRKRVQVIREGEPTRALDLLAVERGIKRSDDPEYEIRAGDLVFVPTATANIRGEVKTGGERPIGTHTQLYDFIMIAAGGFNEDADRTNVMIKRGDKEITVNITEVANGTRSPDDPALEVLPGDQIFVPNNEKKLFVIVGGVAKPGRYPVRPSMTLLDALAEAGNLSPNASKKQFVVAPAELFNPDGTVKGLPKDPKEAAALAQKAKKDPSALGMRVVDIKALIKGDPTQNVPVNPGDRILVPEEPPRQQRNKPSFLQSILQMVPLAGMFMGVPSYGVGYGGFGF